MKALRSWIWIVSSLFIFMFVACGGSGSGGSSSSNTGTLSLSLSDATTDEYNAVYVTIEEVQVHKDEDSHWQVVASPYTTYNLLELVNGVRESLGITDLETGHYTQMRMIIGEDPDNGINTLSEGHPYANYIVDDSNNYHELKVSSGSQTGIKIVNGFDINENQTTDLILDFDASKSIVMAGNSGQWLLKPTIKVLDEIECSIISGTVTDLVQGDTLEGVLVSAQIYDPDAADAKDKVVVQTSTVTDEEGSYTIFLEPGTYNIVGYKDGYDPACAEINAESSSTYTQNLTLTTVSTGTVSGSVNITGGSDEQHVTLSYRQMAQCNSADEQIEVKSLNVANGGSYSVSLPEGTYSVVSSTDTAVQTDTVDTDTTLDIIF